MSDLINNRDYRKQVLKEIISELHRGKGVAEVKRKFEETFDGVSATEIAEVEQALIMEGLPVAEVQRLCDVHASVFKGSVADIHKGMAPEDNSHPISVLKSENRAIEKLMEERIKPHLQALAASGGAGAAGDLKEDMALLSGIDIHYKKKENLLFPFLEQYGTTAPPKVMWGVDDEIRVLIKEASSALEGASGLGAVQERIEEALNRVSEMIFKEENILFPMLEETLTEDEWKRISEESREYGYCLIADAPVYSPAQKQAPAKTEGDGALTLPSGALTLEEIVRMLNTLPFDITFVGKDDTVKYFSQGADRIFARTKAIIGRKVTNCHPPASVHIVEKIVADLKSGKKDHEDFWIRMGGRYVLIRYYAVRSDTGEYMGTMEVSQDIALIQAVTGEKRLLSD
jgi:DUF438 domain-containing protein